jgi:pyrimidine operon attenuation protein/uracil phosphoribosyltransferase
MGAEMPLRRARGALLLVSLPLLVLTGAPAAAGPDLGKLAALIDRGGRELPIAPRVVGRTIEVPAEVKIELSRADDGRFALTLEQASA